jgi:ABC-type branched-subunit amino acid transport system ATPase component
MDGLVATGIVKRFGGLVALDGAEVTAPLGTITGLIGPNGAGKTTLFNVCCGYLRPDAGRILLDGEDITGEAPARRARRGLGRTFQRMELFATLTVAENVEMAAEAVHVGDDPLSPIGLRGGGRRIRAEVRERAAEILDLVDLGPLATKVAGALSTGQGRLVELARALARQPRLLLLDEPSSGLDASETAAFGALLERIVADQSVGILLVEHDMSLVLRSCSMIHVLDFGQPLFHGTPDEVRASEVVRAAYLGSEALTT